MFLIPAVMLLSIPATAQEQACPVKIGDVRSVAGRVTLLFTNTSQTGIGRVEFVVALLDSRGGEHYLPLIASRKHLMPSQAGTASTAAGEATQLSIAHARAYLLHVNLLTAAPGTTTACMYAA